MNPIPSAAVLLALLAAPPPSDPVGVFAVLDRVVLLPDPTAPTSVELHGAFALAEGGRGAYYRAPVRGLLRFVLGSDAEECVRQWRDLERLAGSGRVVSFASRHQMLGGSATPPQVVPAGVEPQPAQAALPAYTTGWGVHPLEQVEHGPARELLLLPRCEPVTDLGRQEHPSWPERRVTLTCVNAPRSEPGAHYVFLVETSDGERFASGLVPAGDGRTTWKAPMALQVGERVTWSVHVAQPGGARTPQDRSSFVVPAAAVESAR